MTCDDVRKKLNRFLKNELEDGELAEFLHHLKVCRDCREELEIQILSEELLSDDVNSFSVSEKMAENSFSTLINNRRKQVARNRMELWIEIAVASLTVIAAFLLYLL